MRLSSTVNPRISPLGAYVFLILFEWGHIKLSDTFRIKSSLSKLLFSIVLKE